MPTACSTEIRETLRDLAQSVMEVDDRKRQRIEIGSVVPYASVDYREEETGDLTIQWRFGDVFRKLAAGERAERCTEQAALPPLTRDTCIHLCSYHVVRVGMKTAAFISQKGGVGKTTLATALAVAAHLDGRSAAVVDLDPQASASFWKDARQAGCDLAVIDAPPMAKDIAFEAARHADFILVPARPAVLDVMAISRTLELVAHYGRPAAVVLSLCPARGREV